MELADAYVTWKAKASSTAPSLPSDDLPSNSGNMSTPNMSTSNRSMPQPSSPSSLGSTPDSVSSYDFNIATIDIYTLDRNHNIHRTLEMKTAVALMSHLLLSNVPLLPSLALSLTTLELYRRLRLLKPSFSKEALAKVVCDLYMVGYFTLRSEILMFTMYSSHINLVTAKLSAMPLRFISGSYEL